MTGGDSSWMALRHCDRHGLPDASDRARPVWPAGT